MKWDYHAMPKMTDFIEFDWDLIVKNASCTLWIECEPFTTCNTEFLAGPEKHWIHKISM